MLGALALVLASTTAVAQAQNFWPAAVPLSVKSPYHNEWLDMPAADGQANLYRWPRQWTMNHILGHAGFVRVDGLVYEYLGNQGELLTANLTGLTLTPTSTKFSMQAVGMDVNITFLSPIEMDDMAKQSYPFTYISVDLASNDGNAHDVQLYMDISGEWISDSGDNTMKYSTVEPSDSAQIVYHTATRTSPEQFTETNGTAEDATVFFGMQYDSSVTYGIANSSDSRSWFDHNKILNNTVASTQDHISDNFPVFALAKDLGSIQSTSTPIVYALGLVRDPVVQYKSAPDGTTESRSPYWKTKYGNGAADGISDFLNDFSEAQKRAQALDDKITSSASTVSNNMKNLASLTTRSLIGSMEITYGSDADDIMIFVKGMGSQDAAGARRTNPVEELYAAWPSVMYLNAGWGRYILEPMLKYQSSDSASASYAAPDLGDQYPAVPGGDAADDMAIEESGSMLLMTWAQARFSGDTHIVDTYYDTLKAWADYLGNVVLTPRGFVSGDGIKVNNQTNLALKGILGIRAMSELARIHGDSDAADQYTSSAESLIAQWQTLAGSSGHLTSVYGDDSSWTMAYNLYPDKWLGLNLVDDEVYSNQTSFFTQLGSSQYGVAFDSSQSTEARSQWTLWTAATMTNNQTRDALIASVHSRASNNGTGVVFPAIYDTQSGASHGGEASASLGAMFAPMALQLPVQIQSGSGRPADADSGGSNAGAIAGGVVGGVAAIALVVLAVFFWKRKQQKQKAEEEEREKYFEPTEAHGVAPYDYAPVVPRQQESDRPQTGYSTTTGQQPYSTHAGSESEFSHAYAAGYGYQGVQPRTSEHNTATTSVGGTPQAPPLPRKGSSNTIVTNPQQLQQHQSQPSTSQFTQPVSPSAPGSSQGRSSDSGANPDLRNEVEALRREMQEIRAAGGVYEPPPMYGQ